MEARKIIQFGNSSHVISIPKAWIKENKLKKGDLIFIEKNSDGELVLLPKEKREEKSIRNITISVDNKEGNTIKREIISAYLNNYNLINIVGKNFKNNSSIIRKKLNNLVGIEIVEQNPRQIIIKDILNVVEVPLGEIVRRIDNTLRAMFLEIKELKEKKKNKIIEIDKDINKLNFLVLKLIRKGLEDQRILRDLKLEPKDAMTIAILVINLEHMGDKLKDIAESLFKVSLSERKKILELIEELEATYTESMKAYYKSDKELAQKISQNKNEFIKKCRSLGKGEKMARVGEKLEQIQNLIYQIEKLTYDL